MNADITVLQNLAIISGSPGPGELIVLFVVILLLFGPKKLPSIARSIGKTLDELRKASNDFKDQIMKIDEHPSVDVEADEISTDDPFDYSEDDGFDEFDMHMGETGEEDHDDSGDAADADKPEDVPSEKKAEVEEVKETAASGSDGEDSKKDDNAG